MVLKLGLGLKRWTSGGKGLVFRVDGLRFRVCGIGVLGCGLFG